MQKFGFALFACATSIVAMASVARAECSDGTVRGRYAFTVHGQSLSPDGTASTGLIDGVGLIAFDGQGNLAQKDYVVSNGTEVPGGPTDENGFHTGETGTYAISADCTGTAEIVFGPGTTVRLALVVADSAQTIHTVVTAATEGGNPAGRQVYSDLERINRR